MHFTRKETTWLFVVYLIILFFLILLIRKYSHETLYPRGINVVAVLFLGSLSSRAAPGWYRYVAGTGFGPIAYLLGSSFLIGLLGTAILLMLNYYIRISPVKTIDVPSIYYSWRDYSHSSGKGSSVKRRAYEANIEIEGNNYTISGTDNEQVPVPDALTFEIARGVLGLWIVVDKHEPSEEDPTGQ